MISINACFVGYIWPVYWLYMFTLEIEVYVNQRKIRSCRKRIKKIDYILI